MTAARLHDLGSALEAAALMSPATPIKIDIGELARALMWAAAQLEARK